MRLLELHIKNYGRLSNKKIELKDGINIIYGENEAGKSTIHSFIRGMFFGLERQRGRLSKGDHYIRYQPWEQAGQYGGTMDVEYQDRKYRIYRDFSKDTRMYKVVDLATGREQLVEDKKGISFIEGLTEDNYVNTVSVEQLKAKTNQGLAVEVKNHLANLTTSKSNQIHVDDALTQLKGKKKQLEHRDTDKKISDIKEQIREIEQQDKQISRLYQQMDNLSNDIVKEQNRLNHEDLLKLESYIGEYPGIIEKYNQLQRVIQEKEELEENNDIEKTDKKGNQKSQYVKYLWGLIPIIILLTGLIIKQTILIYAGIGIIGIVGVYLLMNRLNHTSIQIDVDSHREHSLGRLSDIMHQEERAIKQYASRIMNMEELDTISMNNLEEEIVSLKENLERKREQARERIQHLHIDMEKLRWELDQLLQRENLEVELRESMKELISLKSKEDKEIQAIGLAVDTIHSLSAEIHDTMGQSINHRVSNIVKSLTKGRYSSVMMDENLTVKVVHKGEYIQLESLSVGMIEQIYLALRVAISNILFPQENIPLILDDAFAYYDDERLLATLEMLGQEDRQILIFTCHKREEEMLERLGITYYKIDLMNSEQENEKDNI